MKMAPKKIWAFHDGPMVGYHVGKDPGWGPNVCGYVREDIAEFAISALESVPGDSAHVSVWEEWRAIVSEVISVARGGQ